MHHSIAPRPRSEGAVPHHHRRTGLRQALFGLGVQHLGDELRRRSRQRHPRAERRRQARRLRARHRRGRLQPLSSRMRRRHRLGDRLGLFRLPQSRRHLLGREVRRPPPSNEQIKMVELKLSQGAKPGHGGVLPAPKVSEEISLTRGVPMGEDCISPVAPFGLLDADRDDAVHRRDAPAVGRQAGRLQALHRPRVGVPGDLQGDARDRHLSRLHRGRRQGRRHRRRAAGIHRPSSACRCARASPSCTTRWSASARASASSSAPAGKIISAFDIARAMALGADWCNAARGFMFALGCIQSQSCHTDRCPTGVATQDPHRQRALVVPDKSQRVANFHAATLHALARADGGGRPRPSQRVPARPYLAPHLAERGRDLRRPLSGAAPSGELVDGTDNPRWRRPWDMASAKSFRAVA